MKIINWIYLSQISYWINYCAANRINAICGGKWLTGNGTAERENCGKWWNVVFVVVAIFGDACLHPPKYDGKPKCKLDSSRMSRINSPANGRRNESKWEKSKWNVNFNFRRCHCLLFFRCSHAAASWDKKGVTVMLTQMESTVRFN